MLNREFYITEDGIRLHAKLDFPAGQVKDGQTPERCPLVIVVHGFTGHMEEPHIVGCAASLNEIGYATLRIDMYGHGGSDGDFFSHTLFKWLTNVLTVIDYARSLPFVTDLFLCGHSQGGLAVMLAGAMEQDVIRAIIPMSPAIMIPELARNGSLLGLSFDPEQIPDKLAAWDNRVLSGNYVRVAQTIHVEEAIDRFRKPVLLIHGDADEAVPYHYSQEAVKRYADAKLVTIHGDTHCYDNHLDLVLAALQEFMRKFL